METNVKTLTGGNVDEERKEEYVESYSKEAEYTTNKGGQMQTILAKCEWGKQKIDGSRKTPKKHRAETTGWRRFEII